jgi:CubicO group peptidase (beta-lactamase class C family)
MASFDPYALAAVDTLIEGSIFRKIFPGAAVAIGRKDALVMSRGFGTYTYESSTGVTTRSPFDLASLTKVVATTTVAMKLVESGQLDLEAKVGSYLPEFAQQGKEHVTIRHLLTHTSGLRPFRRFYEEGITTSSALLEAIYADTLIYDSGTEYRYSDFGMIVLAKVIERITDASFPEYAREMVFEPLGMHNTGFRSARNEGDDDRFVPTEIDDYFRHQLIQGEVHDEAAWILGGTAGHAGLFSCLEDLTLFAQMMLNNGKKGNLTFLQPETISLFTRRLENDIEHTRALGWDTRVEDGYSSAGTLLSPRSFGHTGFTGTSIWMDPDADLFVILLTNRVYPTRDNPYLGEIRAQLADIAYASQL